MNVLVLSTDYPTPERPVALMYVHVRNKYYSQHGINVTVLNFNANKNYFWEGIPVITLKTYKRDFVKKKYDLLICHAPNIRNHYRFLKKYEKKFPFIVFFFHGHEVLYLNKVYPKPFPFQKKSYLKIKFRGIYDNIKLRIWNKYLIKISLKSHFVFVSKWLYNEFLKWTKIDSNALKGKYSIIYNSVGDAFEKNSYDLNSEKTYDFITIRNNLDGPKYGVDIVNNLAKNNPHMKFLLIGKGELFNHIQKAPNLTWISTNLSHNEMLYYLDQSKCGLFPTRQDTQGVMACEVAVYGLPIITSDIKVCHEVFEGFKNVAFIKNEDISINLKPILDKLFSGVPYEKNTKFFAKNCVNKELELFERILKKDKV